MTIIKQLIAKAFEYANKHGVELADFGVSASMVYATVSNKDRSAIGVTLIPHGEGALSALKGLNIEEIFENAHGYNPLQRALALALVNALGQHALGEDSTYVSLTSGTRSLLLEKILEFTKEGDEIVFIGNLAPIVSKLKENGRKPIVFCRQKDQYAHGVYSDIFEYEAIVQSPIAIITGATLIGSTLDALIALSPKNSIRILAGFSAGAHPSWFEGTGVTHLTSMKLDVMFKEALLKNRWEEVFSYSGYWSELKH
ncbi:MAG: DUF364 domain-containing protein [Sulfurospirillaceae bacterium]|nr:DUF364 domain-containing protein [Sulfurospirillaceae bacterium]